MEKPPTDPEHYKFLGSLVGTVASLLYFWPPNIKEVLRRGAFSYLAGCVFYFAPAEFFNWEISAMHVLGGGALISFLAWPLAGVIVWAAKSRAKPSD